MNRLARIGLVVVVGVLLGGAGAQAIPSTTVVISQVYGGGGNLGAPYTNDYVELHNVGSTAVDLGGWSVQYASATGTTWHATALSGTLQAGGYFLVQEIAGGTGAGVALPTPDAAGAIAMNSDAGKVALVTGTALLADSCPAGSIGVLDFAGYGAAASCYEGSSGPTPAPSKTTAVARTSGGCTDTDDNSTDFSAGTPAPRNSSSALRFCVPDDAPAVESTSPAAGATEVALGASVTIEFNEPVAVTGSWFSIFCATSGAHTAAQGGGPATYTLDPDDNFVPAETCEVTISGSHVADDDLNDPPDAPAADYTYSFDTVVPAAYVVSSSDDDPVAGQSVTIRAQLVNASGSPIAQAGTTVNWSSTGAGGSLSSACSQTNSDGVATVELTTSTLAGITHSVTATAASSPAVAGVSGPVTTRPGPAHHLAFTSSTADLASETSRTLTAEVRDANENLVTSDDAAEVVFAKSEGSGTVDGLGTATASSGVAAMTVTGKTAGAITITAASADLLGASTSLTIVAGQADHLVFVSPAGDVPSGTTAELTAEIRDVNENVVASDGATAVTFAKTSGSGTVADLGSATASGGIATRPVSAVSAGPVTLTATAPGLVQGSKTFTIVPGAADRLVFTSSTSPLSNGTNRLLTVEVRDAHDNLVADDSGREVTFAQISGDGAVSGLGHAVTDGGVAQQTVAGTSGGPVTISATTSLLAGAATAFTVLAADGSGTMTTPTVRAVNGSSGNTIAFTYTVAAGGIANGQLTLTVPTGWSAPSTLATASGYVTSSAGALSTSSQTIVVSGLTLAGGGRLKLVYGSKAAGGTGAQAPATGGATGWRTRSKASPAGTVKNILSSPSINVLAKDGSGTLSTPINSIQKSSTGNTITFTYTAAAGGIYNGAVTLVVPAGWSVPSTTGTAPGFVKASTGTLSVSGSTRTITVSGLTRAGGQTFTIVYGSKGSGGPGATVPATTGTHSWGAKSKATSGGTLTSLASSPSISVTP